MSELAIFILTHGRPDKVYTWESLRKGGCTDDVYIIIDDEDETAERYYEKFGDRVRMFNKREMAKRIDEADNFKDKDRRSIVYARNACFDIAEDLGYTYFIELDDDYRTFSFKLDENLEMMDRRIHDVSRLFRNMLAYYKSIPALSIAMAQTGDFIGGVGKTIKAKRKCMNTMICSTERPYQFMGRINEDVNAYTLLGSRGGLFLTIPWVTIIQGSTQKTPGGMTEIYKDNGTYVKSFYTVVHCPAFVRIAEMGAKYRRLHHLVRWGHGVPKIVDEGYRKART